MSKLPHQRNHVRPLVEHGAFSCRSSTDLPLSHERTSRSTALGRGAALTDSLQRCTSATLKLLTTGLQRHGLVTAQWTQVFCSASVHRDVRQGGKALHSPERITTPGTQDHVSTIVTSEIRIASQKVLESWNVLDRRAEGRCNCSVLLNEIASAILRHLQLQIASGRRIWRNSGIKGHTSEPIVRFCMTGKKWAVQPVEAKALF